MTQSISSPSPRIFNCQWTWWFTLAVLAVVTFVRISAMNFPLGRDEGEYAYAGQLILQGIPPYKLAYNMKFPGTYLGYAAIMALFGQTPGGIHFGVMCMTTLTALMLYWLGKKMFDPVAGMVAATSYAILATESGMFGMSGHATHFGAFFTTAGLCAIWQARQKSNPRLAGIAGTLFGLAILMKQHAVFLCAWAGIIFLWDCWGNRQISVRRRFLNFGAVCVGILLPFAICCLWLWSAGVFGEFWFWTIDYARQYISILTLSTAGERLWWSLRSIALEDYLLWIIVVVGFALLWLDKRSKKFRLWLFTFAIASILTTVPGFYFRTHYFLLALPAAALLAAATMDFLHQVWNRHVPKFQNWIPSLFYILLVVVTLFQNHGVWSLFVRASNKQILLAHEFFGHEPFPEAEAVSKFIDDNSKPDARVAVLGSEPEIYFLSHRHSATGYIYMYPLMEPQPFAGQMQRDMIRQIETNAPEFVVHVNMASSWLKSPQSDRTIFNWWQNYQTNYVLVGMTDNISLTDIRFVFGTNAVAKYGRMTTNGMAIYRRRQSDINTAIQIIKK